MDFFKKRMQEKMCKNCKLALKERAPFFYPFYKGVFASLKEVFLSKKTDPSDCLFFMQTSLGRRMKNEDEHFLIQDEKGSLVGVLDGHNGGEVAHYVKNRFLESFLPLLEDLDGSVYEAFLHFFYVLQEELQRLHPEWELIGSTAIISYLEKSSNYLYTATLGDSEANIYRLVNKKRKSIPLSPLRNWSTKRDFASAKSALGVFLPRKKNPKEMRLPPYGQSSDLGFGLNVSRALGDVAFKGVIHSPKITLTTLLRDDIVLLACDGLKDYVSEKEITKIIEANEKRESLAQELIDYAIFKKSSLDNVTVALIVV